MGIYNKKVFKKDKYGLWELVSESSEKLPHSKEFWLRNSDIEKSSNLREKTYLIFQSSSKGKSQVVVSAITYFGSNEKVERKLLTTSNTFSKK